MDIAKLLLIALGIMTVVYGIYLVKDVISHKEEHLPLKMVPVLLIGLLANFFDTNYDFTQKSAYYFICFLYIFFL